MASDFAINLPTPASYHKTYDAGMDETHENE
jgi:hypothetical protein